MPRYVAHGLVVESDIRLPGLKTAREDPDVYVRVGDVPETPNEPVEDNEIHRVEGGHYLKLSGTGAVYGSDGRRVVVEPESDADSSLLRWFVLSQGFRILLHQRGYVVLHASATVVNGHVVAFLGESGQGKSTTIAAWYAAGYPVLSDDVTAVDPDTRLVKPGIPQIKLDSKSASAVDADFTPAEKRNALPRRYYTTPTDFRDESVPLGGLYFLEDGPDVRIEALPPAERPYRLMCASVSTYRSTDDRAVESHLDDCVRLSSNVPVKRLERPRTFDSLPDLVSAVEDDLAEPAPTGGKLIE